MNKTAKMKFTVETIIRRFDSDDVEYKAVLYRTVTGDRIYLRDLEFNPYDTDKESFANITVKSGDFRLRNIMTVVTLL